MIVKNDIKTILSAIESIAGIIDTYCICDVGSIDDTKEIIEAYFEKKKIKGMLFEHMFKDFGYNRTVAYNEARKMADYVIFLDANSVITINPPFVKKSLIHEKYLLRYRYFDHTSYKCCIYKSTVDAICTGLVYEY